MTDLLPASGAATTVAWTASTSTTVPEELKAITAVEVKGRIGPGGVEGILVTFDREKH